MLYFHSCQYRICVFKGKCIFAFHLRIDYHILFLVLFCSIAAYLLWNEVMKYLGPVMANNYLYAQPIVTMIAAYFVFGENVNLLGYVGCGLIIGGLIISDKMKDGIRLRRQ